MFLFLLLTAFSKRRITNTRKRAITNCALHYRNHWFCKFYWHWVDCGLQWKTSQILNAACEAKNFTPSPRLKTTSCKVCKHSIHLVPAPKLYNLLPKHLRDLLALSSLRNLETYKCYANLLRCMLIAQTAFYKVLTSNICHFLFISTQCATILVSDLTPLLVFVNRYEYNDVNHWS